MDTAEALRAALDAGSLSAAEYVKRARELGVDAASVAAAIKATVVASPAPDPPRSTANTTAAAEVQATEISDVPIDDVEAALAWLQARPGKWGSRAAERLGPGNDFLYDLDLYDSCDIDDAGVRVLATALAANSTVTSVNLNSNAITGAGVGHLCAALQKNSTVTSLDLGQNYIGSDGVDMFSRFLASDECRLRQLVLTGNPGLEHGERNTELRAAWGTREPAGLHV